MYTRINNMYATSIPCGNAAFVRNTHVQDEQAPGNMHKYYSGQRGQLESTRIHATNCNRDRNVRDRDRVRQSRMQCGMFFQISTQIRRALFT